MRVIRFSRKTCVSLGNVLLSIIFRISSKFTRELLPHTFLLINRPPFPNTSFNQTHAKFSFDISLSHFQLNQVPENSSFPQPVVLTGSSELGDFSVSAGRFQNFSSKNLHALVFSYYIDSLAFLNPSDRLRSKPYLEKPSRFHIQARFQKNNPKNNLLFDHTSYFIKI